MPPRVAGKLSAILRGIKPHIERETRMHTIGTAHFISLGAAIRYYRPYGFDKADVARKVAEGEIYIGKPETKPNEEIFTRDGRYHIQVGY
jgi:hypothetical protein